MDSLWTWTRPSTNTMTSAHTPAPCWTLSSDQGISLPKPIHTQFIQAMGIISSIFKKKLFVQWRNVLDWNAEKLIKKNWTRYCGVAWSLRPGSPCPFTVMTPLPGGMCREFHRILSIVTLSGSQSVNEQHLYQAEYMGIYAAQHCLKKLPMYHSLLSPHEHTGPYLDQCQRLVLSQPVLKCRAEWNLVGRVTQLTELWSCCLRPVQLRPTFTKLEIIKCLCRIQQNVKNKKGTR